MEDRLAGEDPEQEVLQDLAGPQVHLRIHLMEPLADEEGDRVHVGLLTDLAPPCGEACQQLLPQVGHQRRDMTRTPAVEWARRGRKQAYLMGPIRRRGGRAGPPGPAVIDEGHLLTTEQLEAIRLLTNDDTDSRSPLACVILGRPTLRRRLRLGAYAALDQRVALRYHLEGMALEETASYLRHHLKLAGCSNTPPRRRPGAAGSGTSPRRFCALHVTVSDSTSVLSGRTEHPSSDRAAMSASWRPTGRKLGACITAC